MEKLDVLNELLEAQKTLPSHRARVGESGQNLVWLRKHLRCEGELKKLLSMEMHQLRQPVDSL